MTAPLVVITGTGTGIGKTMTSTALVSAWADRGIAVAGIKPIESGIDATGGDVLALERVSTFHVTRFSPPYLLVAPVSPHLAARREGRVIDVSVILDWVGSIREQAEATVLELAGGLYSPISENRTNADVLRALSPSKTLLVAPDRLGVLHDVIATTRAAAADGLHFDGLILSAPEAADSSTGTNAEELRLVHPDLPVLAELPRASMNELRPHLARVLEQLEL